MSEIKLNVWRHKQHKDIYLVRNTVLCGGNVDSEFYKATRSIITAIKSAEDPNFEGWMGSFIGDDGKTELKARIVDCKDVEIDGYKGTLTKELKLLVKDFEKIQLVECEVQNE